MFWNETMLQQLDWSLDKTLKHTLGNSNKI